MNNTAIQDVNDQTCIMLALIVVLMFVGIVLLHIFRERAKVRFCMDCESTFNGVVEGRPLWPLLLLGVFGLLWKKRIICPVCKHERVIPADSQYAKNRRGSYVSLTGPEKRRAQFS